MVSSHYLAIDLNAVTLSSATVQCQYKTVNMSCIVHEVGWLNHCQAYVHKQNTSPV